MRVLAVNCGSSSIKCAVISGEKPAHSFDTTADLKTQHGTEAVLLRLRNLMPGVRGQAGVMHGRHGRMLAEKSGD